MKERSVQNTECILSSPQTTPDPVLKPSHVSSRYPGRKDEQWWLVLGDAKANTLLAIKRVKLGKAANVTLEFSAPATAGRANLMLYFMCDSYMGADQEYEVRP